MTYCVVYVTAPTGAKAKSIARVLVRDRLAACVNIVPSVNSVYRWKGKIESAREALLVVKTRRSLLPRLAKRVRAVHPYAVPEIVALPLMFGEKSYLRWLDAETRDR